MGVLGEPGSQDKLALGNFVVVANVEVIQVHSSASCT